MLDSLQRLRDREHRHRVRLGRRRLPTRCSATPTSRCTRRRPAARTARACSRARCTCAAVERLDLEAHLRGAAERGELVVHYQPIFELAAGPHRRARSARALAAPRARPARPAVVHPVRRGGRPHRRDRPARARDRVRRSDAAGSRLVGARTRPRSASTSRPASCSTRGSPTGSSRSSTRCGLEPRPPDPRDHRRRAR